MYNSHRGLGFLFGAFMIIFTFVSWAPAKWFFFGIGVVLILHAFMREDYLCENCKGDKPMKKPMKKKK